MVSLRHKLLLFILPLCLALIVGISAYSYYVAKDRITGDRTVLYLERVAVNTANTIRIMLQDKVEEMTAMSRYRAFRLYLAGRDPYGLEAEVQILLDEMVVIHQDYDVLALFDMNGVLLVSNSISRNPPSDEAYLVNPRQLRELRGKSLVQYIPGEDWLQDVRSGFTGYINWHSSQLVSSLYNYQKEDIARQYSVGYATPILNFRNEVVGGILGLMNWELIQGTLDTVESDLKAVDMTSGYAFLLDDDFDTVIGHKYRRNRPDNPDTSNNYGLSLTGDFGLVDLHNAMVEEWNRPVDSSTLMGSITFPYEYPVGIKKISGLAPVTFGPFWWMCGVGINDEEIFAPVQTLLERLIGIGSLLAVGIVLLTYLVSRRITTPLKQLAQGVRTITSGNLSQRVEISSSDEIGELANNFNEMSQSLQERTEALRQLNKDLEGMVKKRTGEIEEKSEQVQQAYQELKDTQVQLVQSEKMASLGQLVAGIAHEIKNPLNFIYGNTDFLREYIDNLQRLVELYEGQSHKDPKISIKVESFKQEVNYDFMLEDLQVLIKNFEEGANRIHDIISDLKSFSRTDSEQFQSADIHETLDLVLNILHNEYRDRISVHKEYGQIPHLECHPGKMTQVFINLLNNACQAIAEQGDIWIRTSKDGDFIVIEIEDNGPGIEGKQVEKIFEPFFTTKPVGKGTGLGLSISYGIIQQHGGTVTVESDEGKGAKFCVKLPLDHLEKSAS